MIISMAVGSGLVIMGVALFLLGLSLIHVMIALLVFFVLVLVLVSIAGNVAYERAIRKSALWDRHRQWQESFRKKHADKTWAKGL